MFGLILKRKKKIGTLNPWVRPFPKHSLHSFLNRIAVFIFELFLGVWLGYFSAVAPLALEHWLEVFSLRLLTLKRRGHLASLNQ
jgi:hypothetical protein